MVAGLKQQTEIIMAQIGTFTRGEDGVFAGTIKTLSLNVQSAPRPRRRFHQRQGPGPAGCWWANVEIGAAWHRTSKENTEYHSVKLDDPSFSAPIYANLFKGETDYNPRLVTLTDRCRDGSPAEPSRLFPRDYVERGDPETRRKHAFRRHHSA